MVLVSHAQLLEQVQTDSDWEELYYRGYFDYETFRIYSELSEGLIVPDTLSYLESALGNSIAELTSSAATEERPSDTTVRVLPHLYFRASHRRNAGVNTGYYLAKASGEKASIEYKARKDSETFKTERRSLTYYAPTFALTIGNFTADFGAGLGIGRYDYRPFNSSSAGDEQSFLYPENSYYNGLMASYRDRLHVIYSARKHYIRTPLEYKKEFIAGALTYPLGEITLGATLGNTIFNRKDYNRSLGVVSLFCDYPLQRIRSEIAYAESGAGFFLGLDKDGYTIELWHYDSGYINPQSSGRAYPDYDLYRPFDAVDFYRQRQTGETGMQIGKRYSLGRLNSIGVIEIWKRSPHETVAADYSMAGLFALGRGFACRARFAQRLRDEPLAITSTDWERSLTDFGLAYEGRFRIDLFTSLWISDSSVELPKSLSQVYGFIPLVENFSLAGRFRSYFDGDYQIFAEGKLAALENISFKATYRWWNKTFSNDGTLYLVGEAVF